MTTFKKGDDGDPIRAQLRDEDGVVDLSDVDEVNIFFYPQRRESKGVCL